MSAEAALRFGPEGRFELLPVERRLLVDGEPAALGSRAFDLLLALASQPGTLRSKNELIEAVWPGVVVEEGNLPTQISTLRKILGGDVIATIPGRGYRFTAPLGGAAAAAPTGVAEAPTSAATEKLHTNLPAELPPLIGRADDLAALHDLVGRHRLVSIVGAGGMGKTALAQAFLHTRRDAYPHGVCWVDLAPVSDPEAIASTVATALGLRLGGSEPLKSLCAATAPLELLLALDNAEHLLEGTARVAQALVQAAPRLRLLVTSQAPLQVATEQLYRLGALAVPQDRLPLAEALSFGAVQLFADRAQLADSRFALTEAGLPAVIDVCRQLDGLPLAIELAAARAPMLGVHKLAASMGDRLKLLTGSRNRMAPARQQTLRGALGVEPRLLDKTERTVFRRLAVFAGSGSLAMVQQVVADGTLDEWAVLDALVQLIDRSLVVALTPDDGSEPRYRLLDSPRAFALEELKRSGEEEALRLRHMQAMATFCEAQWHVEYSGEIGVDDWRRALALDADNAADAMAHATLRGDKVAALRITLMRLRMDRNMHAARQIELREQCFALIDDTVPRGLQVRALLQSTGMFPGNRSRFEEMARRGLDLVQRAPELREDRFLCYWACCRFVLSKRRGTGQPPEIEAALTEARRLEDPAWAPWRRLHRAQAETVALAGDSTEAVARCREWLALDLASGGNGFLPRSNLIEVELAVGEVEAAAATGEALLAELARSRDERAIAFARLNLAGASLALDRLARARELAIAGWPQGQAFGLRAYWADYLALLAALEGRPRAAARLVGFADAAYASNEDSREPNEAAAQARADALARAALGDAAFERLRAEGALLRDADIEAIAFATEDPA